MKNGRKQIDLTGKQFGRWTVIEFHGIKNKSSYLWLCQCECGERKLVGSGHLMHNRSKGCKECKKKNYIGEKQNNFKHGKSDSLEYKIWQAMKNRCTNKNVDSYVNYGGRGIKVCERWLNSFENFYADMGPRPGKEYSIDRINNDDNYEPNNCRWATKKEQQNNRRNSKKNK